MDDGDEELPAWPDERLLTGTPAFEALFAALEDALPPADATGLAMLLSSSVAWFG